MNVLDKLSILSAMLNCGTCGNCVAKGYCNTIRSGSEKQLTIQNY